MATLCKIDTYTHIVNKDIFNQYNATPFCSEYAIIMEFSPYFATADMEDDSWKVCGHSKRLFLCPSVDLTKGITEQLQIIEKKLRIRPECHVIGLIIYLTGSNDNITDTKILPVYDFAKKHNLSIVFHTGLPSAHLEAAENTGTSCISDICKLAAKYSTVNFIVAQMDYPRFAKCLQLIHRIPNIFTSFNGAFTPDKRINKSSDAIFRALSLAIMQYGDIYKQMLYGTSFCPPYEATEIAIYDAGIETIYTHDQVWEIYWDNALLAFPKLKNYLI